jgi:2,4-dienoyl-CoA reductase-like NADH-dependent reductase (Old Yellow Enzyme family)
LSYRRIASDRTIEQFLAHVAAAGAELPADAELVAGREGPLGRPATHRGGEIGNRFCILPMEGWDGTTDGRPSDLTRRRWENFGRSGAKLIWGGEAVAVRADGRANPNQLWIHDGSLAEIEGLRNLLVATHEREVGPARDLLVGLQLTHSGRFARPTEKFRPEPRIVYRHPILDGRLGIASDDCLLTDDDVATLRDDFVQAAAMAQKAGFAFVDVKHCHGYFGHELLSAVDRPGKYGGSLENRLRFLAEVVAGVRAEAPGLEVAVRVSAFDWIPFQKGTDGVGAPAPVEGVDGGNGYRYAFGGDGTGLGIDLSEPKRMLDRLAALDVRLVCVSCGSPYYNPHIQRPALFPPSDGYLPPEDPLAGVARQVWATAELKRHRPDLAVVGSGYSYLQEWLPNVAQAVVRLGMADFIGLGRMVLSYPELPSDVLAGRPLARKRICRTFSDCTTAPRNGLVSGCYPLDPFYKGRPEAKVLAEAKQS